MSCPRPNTAPSNPKDIGQLAEPLRSRVAQMIRDAPTGGLVLVSGRRDPGKQWDLRHQRCRGRECDPKCKGYPVTAVPATWNGTAWVGGSKHQRGEAADLGGRDLQWAINNRARYGLGLTVSSENWHFEAAGVDVRTRKRIGSPTVPITPYGGKPPTATPPPAVKPPQTGDWFDMASRSDLDASVATQIAKACADNGAIQKVVAKEVNRQLSVALITLDEQRQATKLFIQAFKWLLEWTGSTRGWVRPVLSKLGATVGVTADDAKKADPWHTVKTKI